MAVVTGFTAARMLEIENTTVVDGTISGDNLLLEQRDGTIIDAGNVRGPQGIPGTNGTNGTNGAQGPAGPTNILGSVLSLTNNPSPMSASGVISGMVKNNVPVTAGNEYGVKIDFTLNWTSVDIDAEWHIWFRLNGSNVERFRALRP